MAYNTLIPGCAGLADRVIKSVQIAKRGTTVGYDNPGFDSPVDFFKRRAGPKLSSMGWPGSPAIGSDDPVICEGSSTPAVSRAAGKDSDSAFQEPSTLVSSLIVFYFDLMLDLFKASSYDDNHHLSVDDDDLQQHMSDSFYEDKQRLIS